MMSDLSPVTPPPVTVLSADVPLLLAVPHAGRALPGDLLPRLTEAGLTGLDTDWHLDRLLNMAPALGIGVVAFQASRMVIDVDQPVGAVNLCPVSTHGDVPFYQPGQAPSADETEHRRATLWQPYHQGLAMALAAARRRFGGVVLLDVHSVRSLHHGDADISIAANSEMVAPALTARLLTQLQHVHANHGLRTRLDLDEPPGFTARHHAQPTLGVHAVRLTVSQALYMEEAPPFRYRRDLASRLEPVLIGLFKVILDWARLTQIRPLAAQRQETLV